MWSALSTKFYFYGMASNTETEINLKTLQRVDSNIVEIIDHASQVAIYKYERKLNKWEGTDIEGTLFLYKRSLYPFHGFIIVNRMSTTNFIEAITSDMEFVQHEPYFLYKKSCGEIIGSWFYEKKDFNRITNKIQSIVLRQNSPRRRQRCSSDSDSQLKKGDVVQDIMSMLSQAHTEYVKNEANELIPEQITNEDINKVSTCTNKKMNNKSVTLYRDKSRSPCMRSSSEEKYPVSPRRRFLSTGSYDFTQKLPLSCNKVINELVYKSNNAAAHSKVANSQHFKDHGLHEVQLFPTNTENIDNLSAPTRLSPLFSHDEISSPTLSGISHLDQSPETPNLTLKPSFPDFVPLNVIQMTTSSKPSVMDNANKNKTEHNMHSSDLKETLKSHVEWDSGIILKIHEAYIASLKSIFTPKKC